MAELVDALASGVSVLTDVGVQVPPLAPKTMLQRTLGSGWGVLLPGLLIAGLMYADLSPDQWRIVILMGLILTPVMLYHKQLRHYILLPSCLALSAGIMLMLMNLNQG